MTGYTELSRRDFKKHVKTIPGDLVIKVLDGAQQAAGMKIAMKESSKVRKFRCQPRHYPVLTIYCGPELQEEDFPQVTKACSYENG
jgi:hypothetical protein